MTDDYHRHELVDRLHLSMDLLHSWFPEDHPAIKEDPKVLQAINDAWDCLYEAYNLSALRHLAGEDK